MQNIIRLYQAGRFPEVVDATSKLLKRDPKSLGLWNLQGASYAAMNDLGNALKSFRRAEKIAPRNADVNNNIGNILSSAKRFEEAEKYFKRAVQARPNFASALANLATALREQGRLDEAAAKYEAAMAADPGYAVAYNGLGGVFAKRKMHAEAIGMYDRAIKLNPKYAEAHSNKGTCLAEIGDLEAAVERHKTAIGLNPRDADFYFAMANTLYEAGKTSEAVEYYAKTVRLDPTHDASKARVGSILLEDEEFEKAEKFFHGLVRSRQDDQLALSFLAKAMLGSGKTHETVMFLRDRINSGENSFESLDRLGSILLEERQYLEALEVYLFGVRTYPKNFQAHIKLGDVRKKMNDLRGAIRSYHDAIQQGPDSPELFLKLGDSHLLSGHISEAVRFFRKARQIGPLNKKSIGRFALLPIGLLKRDEIQNLGESLEKLRPSLEAYEYEAISAQISLHELDFESFCAKVRTANALRLETAEKDSEAEVLRWGDTREKLSSPDLFSAADVADLPTLVLILGPSTSGKSTLERLFAMNDHAVVRDESINFGRLGPFTREDILKLDSNERHRLFTAVFYDELSAGDRSHNVFVCTNPFTVHYMDKILSLTPNVRIVLCDRERTALTIDIFRKFYAHGNLYSYDLDRIKEHLENYFDVMELLEETKPEFTHRLNIAADGRFDPDQLQRLGRTLGLNLIGSDDDQSRKSLFLKSEHYDEIARHLGIGQARSGVLEVSESSAASPVQR